MSDVTEKIKEKLGIVDVVDPYVKLEKAGASFKARCPFHHEKTPSFFVSPARNTYYCFGCGEKGDIFSFVQHFEGLDFPGALRVLGSRAGVQVVAESPARREERTTLFSTLEEATKFFEGQLTFHKEAVAYLRDRGITEKTQKYFRIGYVPDEWERLRNYLASKGMTDESMLKAGLVKEPEDETKERSKARRYYDRFRGRIMFPLADASGRVIAFSGRLFPEDPNREAAKYINSPETTVFTKSRALYGFDKAKMTIRKSNFSIVVEGQVDLVMSHQAGFANTVAISGTALSENHLTLLHRLSPNIVFAFDSDSAGIKTTGKSAEVALLLGMDVKVAKLPRGVDPADLIKEGTEDFREVIRSSKHIIDFYLELLAEEEGDARKRGKKVEEMVLPFVARVKSNIDREHFIMRVANFLGISDDAVREEVLKIPKIASENTTETTFEKKENKHITREDVIKHQLFGIVLWQESLEKPMIDVLGLKKRISALIGKEVFRALLQGDTDAEQEAAFMTEVGYSAEDALENDINELINNLEVEKLKRIYNETLQELRVAESCGDETVVSEKLSACKELSEKLNILQSQNENTIAQ